MRNIDDVSRQPSVQAEGFLIESVCFGGKAGIRTLGCICETPTSYKLAALSHSATLPQVNFQIENAATFR